VKEYSNIFVKKSMEKSDIMKKIREILISILKHSNFEISNELSAKNVEGWDSLTHMIIITEIEKAFNLKFKLKELNRLQNIGSLVELVNEKLR
jgi:acyl carrier protein